MKINNKLIKVKESDIHGLGIYANKNIKKGTKIIEYIGRKVTKLESDLIFQKTLKASEKDNTKGEVYLFELNNKYDIDGNLPENIAKYINHSCEPNCDTEILDDKEIWIIAEKNIEQGEEITYNYGFDFEEHKDYPCKCGTNSCIGFILDKEQWPKLNR